MDGASTQVLPVAIIGGGLAGLQAARLLHEAGIGFRIFEARDRLTLDGDHVRLTLGQTDGGSDRVLAAQVIAALPPRLLEASIAFEPAIDPAIRLRWRDTPTWMAPHAKFVASYDRPFWRTAGLSGMAQGAVGPMGEIHDATTASGAAALFGFLGIDTDWRQSAGTALLTRACLDQLVRLFGDEEGRPAATLLMDWTAEVFTATADDRRGGAHPVPQRRPWVPLSIRRRPGRQTVVSPVSLGSNENVLPTRADPALVKALARAFRYQRLLDEGRYASITEVAAEKIERGYLGSLLRLTLLAPDIVGVVLDGQVPCGLDLPQFLAPSPLEWAVQREALANAEFRFSGNQQHTRRPA